MVNARLCKKTRLAFFFASLRHFDFFSSETEASKDFKCKLEMFRSQTNKSELLGHSKLNKM